MKNAFLLFALIVLGLSPAVFGQSITVETPNGGEQWVLGSTQSIAWQSTSTSGNVLIKLIRNNGDKVGTIAENISVNSSPHSWKVGQLQGNAAVPPGTDYKIRVRVIDNRVIDASNSVFSIKADTAPNLKVCITDGKTAPVFGDRDIHVWVKNNGALPVSGLTLEFYIEGKGTNTYAVSLGPNGIFQRTRNCKWSTKGTKTIRARVKSSGGAQLVEVEGAVHIYLYDPTYQVEQLVKCSDGTHQNEPVL